ncbi:MAG: dienelactone hydrolase family protein [Sandaracinus sp.]|nr:dienelactone hydrolase family protein [Sandaracinus sp.]MCB9623301.1 dienelactone hydrolase family protein [Sandaracinus sp.]MCB9635401.1 dienelactone hydrolase family protein [Sandaracinus sp.]
MGEKVEFRANGHTCEGYLAKPASGSGPGLLVIQEWWGLVPHIQSLADRFAEAGFVALAPDLYHGEKTTSPDEAGRLMMALDIAKSAADLKGAADYLLGLDAVAPKKVGALGFCMGGQLALYAATEHPEISACVDFYGIHPHVKPDFAKLGGKVLCHWGKQDGFVSTEAAEALVASLKEAGADVESHHYDAGHAFFNDSRPEAYDAAAASLAWDRTLGFLRANLA